MAGLLPDSPHLYRKGLPEVCRTLSLVIASTHSLPKPNKNPNPRIEKCNSVRFKFQWLSNICMSHHRVNSLLTSVVGPWTTHFLPRCIHIGVLLWWRIKGCTLSLSLPVSFQSPLSLHWHRGNLGNREVWETQLLSLKSLRFSVRIPQSNYSVGDFYEELFTH